MLNDSKTITTFMTKLFDTIHHNYSNTTHTLKRIETAGRQNRKPKPKCC